MGEHEVASYSSLVLAVCASLPATAAAKVPCRDQVYNDWDHDGKIASKYPVACYRDALRHVPTDGADLLEP